MIPANQPALTPSSLPPRSAQSDDIRRRRFDKEANEERTCYWNGDESAASSPASEPHIPRFGRSPYADA